SLCADQGLIALACVWFFCARRPLISRRLCKERHRLPCPAAECGEYLRTVFRPLRRHGRTRQPSSARSNEASEPTSGRLASLLEAAASHLLLAGNAYIETSA